MDSGRPHHFSAKHRRAPRTQPDAASDTIHRGLAREIPPIVCQPRHELFRREMAVLGTRHEGEHLGFLTPTKRIGRAMSRPTTAVIGVRVASPALNRSGRDTDHWTGSVKSCPGDLGLVEGGQNHGSCGSSVSSSSSSSRA